MSQTIRRRGRPTQVVSHRSAGPSANRIVIIRDGKFVELSPSVREGLKTRRQRQ